jgi:two-component system cell cycle response regulator CtrA
LLPKGRTLDKASFLDHLYGGPDEPDLKIIELFICKLRKNLHAASRCQESLETASG